MTNRSQNYVSKELTHFNGRDLRKPDGSFDQDAQYDRFVKILREGSLRPKEAPDGRSLVEFRGDGSFVGRTLSFVDAVYFCDIPVQGFTIHMGKYGPFGLSFLKSFLVKKGANPAFYVAADSVIPQENPTAVALDLVSPLGVGPPTRGDVMDELIKAFMASSDRLGHMAVQKRMYEGLTTEGAALGRHPVIGMDVFSHFMSFCVPFDSGKEDDDKENFYMEREWRVIGEVKFDLEDVYRAILPSRFAKRFREDVPKYHGQLTFAE